MPGSAPRAADGPRVGATAKGEQRRAQIVEAAAALLLAHGAAAVTHRAVAQRAEVPLAATTYYFAGRDALLTAAGEHIVGRWADAAHAVAVDAATRLRAGGREVLAQVLLDALLPPRSGQLSGHYEHLVTAARVPALTHAFAAGRGRIDAALAAMLAAAGSSCSPALALAVVDGAAVTALSEGRAIRPLALSLLAQVL